MSRTADFIRADLARAKNQGAKTLDISTADLDELLKLADRGAVVTEAEKATKRAGWVNAGSLHSMLSGRANSARIRRRRTDQCNVQIFYSANLHEKLAEARAADEAKAAQAVTE